MVKFALKGVTTSVCVSAVGSAACCEQDSEAASTHVRRDISNVKRIDCDHADSVWNWSGTHSTLYRGCAPGDASAALSAAAAQPKRVGGIRKWEPKNNDELFSLLSLITAIPDSTVDGLELPRKLRPVGSGLSPNGIGLPHCPPPSPEAGQPLPPSAHAGDLLSLQHFSDIHVDPERKLVTVGAGATVADVLAALKERGLTLANFSSITEQTVGGWVAVAAHGTGCSVGVGGAELGLGQPTSTVDDMVQGLRVVAYYDTVKFGTSGASAVAAPELAPCTITCTRGDEADAATVYVEDQWGNALPRVADALQLALQSTDGSSAPSLLNMLTVGLGSLGVTTELTLRCVPMHRLHEQTVVLAAGDVRGAVQALSSGATVSAEQQQLLEQHSARLRGHRHVRYMWVPQTDCLVAVTSNPLAAESAADGPSSAGSSSSRGNTAPMLRLLAASQRRAAKAASPRSADSDGDRPAGRTFPVGYNLFSVAQLRDLLLDEQSSDGSCALDAAHVSRVNAAEARYWGSLNGAERVALSNDVLGFDCGGQQCVLEVCFPMGKFGGKPAQQQEHRDLQFVHRLLDRMREYGIPAHSPIEQRWTAASPSPLSPAYSPDPDDVFCWVGIITYLPAHCHAGGDAAELAKVRFLSSFQNYVLKAVEPLMGEFGAVPHWAKLETPTQQRLHRMYHGCLEDERPTSNNTSAATEKCRQQLAKWYTESFEAKEVPTSTGTPISGLYTHLATRYAQHLRSFANLRGLLDPRGVFSNEVVEEIVRLTRGNNS